MPEKKVEEAVPGGCGVRARTRAPARAKRQAAGRRWARGAWSPAERPRPRAAPLEWGYSRAARKGCSHSLGSADSAHPPPRRHRLETRSSPASLPSRLAATARRASALAPLAAKAWRRLQPFCQRWLCQSKFSKFCERNFKNTKIINVI